MVVKTGANSLEELRGLDKDALLKYSLEFVGEHTSSSAELWYMFGTLDRCWRPMEEEDYRLSRQMLDYWTNFIKKADPNGEGLEEWALCTTENKIVKVF